MDRVASLVMQLAQCLMFDGPPPLQSLLCDYVKQFITVSKI